MRSRSNCLVILKSAVHSLITIQRTCYYEDKIEIKLAFFVFQVIMRQMENNNQNYNTNNYKQ